MAIDDEVEKSDAEAIVKEAEKSAQEMILRSQIAGFPYPCRCRYKLSVLHLQMFHPPTELTSAAISPQLHGNVPGCDPITSGSGSLTHTF